MKTQFSRSTFHTVFFLLFAIIMTSCFSDKSEAQQHNSMVPSSNREADEEFKSSNREADEEFKRQRETWIESMHRAAPGVNWRILDYETRLALERQRKSKLNTSSYAKNHFTKAIPEDTIGGLLRGGWSERGSNNLAGRTISADIDNDRGLIYVASAGGNIWRGTLDGKDWTCLNDNKRMNVVMLRLIPKGNNTRLVVVANGPPAVYTSDDGGLNWQRAKGFSTVEQWGSFNRGVITNNAQRSIYVLGNEWDYVRWRAVTCIYRSDDFGENFSRAIWSDLASSHVDIWSARYESSDVFLVHGDTLSRLNPTGSYTRLVVFPDSGSYDGIHLQGTVQSNTTNLFVLRQRGAKSDLFGSDNGGTSFTYRGNVPTGLFSRNSFCASTKNPSDLYAGGVNVYRSWDGGQDWKLVNEWGEYYGNMRYKLHADIPEITSLRDKNGQEVILISTDGGLFISRNNLSSVQNLSLSGLGVSQYYSTYTMRDNAKVIYAGSQDQGYQRCLSDSGVVLDFTQIISGDYGHLSSSNNGRSLWMNYPGFALYYPNAAGNTKGYSWNFPRGGHLWLPPLAADPFDSSASFVAAGSQTSASLLWRVKLIGKDLEPTPMIFDFSQGKKDVLLSAIAFSPLDGRYAYALTNTGLFFLSVDAGKNWRQTSAFQGPGGHYFYGSVIVPSRTTLRKVYIAGSGYSNPGVYVTTNDGESFTPLDNGLPKTLIYRMDITPDDRFIFAATEIGPYVLIADSAKWFSMTTSNSPDQLFWSVEYVPVIHTARFGTYGRGIWDFKIIESTTGVARTIPSSPPSQAPKMYAYPNPTNDQTSITIDLPEGRYTEVRIYDLTGRVVQNIHAGFLHEGKTTFSWDRKSSGGYALPSGSYLCIANTMERVIYTVLHIAR